MAGKPLRYWDFTMKPLALYGYVSFVARAVLHPTEVFADPKYNIVQAEDDAK